MGSILLHGQGKAGAASADGLDCDKALVDAQPITPPASRAPPLFKNRRREYPVRVSPPPIMVFSSPQYPKGLISSHSPFHQPPTVSLISRGRFPNHEPCGDTTHKSRFSSSHAPDGEPRGNIGRSMRICAFPDGRVRRPCRCVCFGWMPGRLRPPDDMRYKTGTAHCTHR